MPEAAPIGFALEAIQVNGFEEIGSRLPVREGGAESLTYVPSFGLGFDEAIPRIGVSVQMDVFIGEGGGSEDDAMPEEQTDEENRVARIAITCHYRLRSLDGLLDEGGTVRVPRMLVAHLVGMTVSTVRGALVGRAHHPIFQRAPLPTDSPIEYIDDLVEMSGAEWVDDKPAKEQA